VKREDASVLLIVAVAKIHTLRWARLHLEACRGTYARLSMSSSGWFGSEAKGSRLVIATCCCQE
jgi:hypothetical protein